MNKREAHVRKHVHSWQPYCRPANYRMNTIDIPSDYDAGYGVTILHRVCKECGLIQFARVLHQLDLEPLPQSTWHLADVPWGEGIQEPPTPPSSPHDFRFP